MTGIEFANRDFLQWVFHLKVGYLLNPCLSAIACIINDILNIFDHFLHHLATTCWTWAAIQFVFVSDYSYKDSKFFLTGTPSLNLF